MFGVLMIFFLYVASLVTKPVCSLTIFHRLWVLIAG